MGKTKKRLKRHILRLQHDVDALSKTVAIISEDIKKHQCYCENYKPKTVTFKRFIPLRFEEESNERTTSGEEGRETYRGT